MHSTIYDLSCNVLADGVQSQIICDETRIVARDLARTLKRSVVVEDHGTQECYRVTPGGHIWRAPKHWPAPIWQTAEDDY